MKAFNQALPTDSSTPYKFVSIKLQKHPYPLQRKTALQRGPWLQPTVQCQAVPQRAEVPPLTVSTSHITSDTGRYHLLENTPLALPFTRHSSWSACPLLYICVFVVNFCFPSLGLLHLTSGAAALKLFSFNFYVLQNSLRILRSFWCLYLPLFTVLKLKLKLKYIKIQAKCFGRDSKSSENDSRN